MHRPKRPLWEEVAAMTLGSLVWGLMFPYHLYLGKNTVVIRHKEDLSNYVPVYPHRAIGEVLQKVQELVEDEPTISITIENYPHPWKYGRHVFRAKWGGNKLEVIYV
jgi:hypothetical protein